jgi:hypothetical protein
MNRAYSLYFLIYLIRENAFMNTCTPSHYHENTITLFEPRPKV